MKKLIINADDFGYSAQNNEAVKLGCESGIITSCSIITNMNGFEHALKEVIPSIPFIDLGFHFNIMEGRSITNPKSLCDTQGYFNNGYLKLIAKSHDPEILKQIEQEFRAQIEKILEHYPISHIDSHVHTHAIPQFFNLITKLAQEYNIKYIRTQREIPYVVPKKLLNKKFPLNTIKNILLNSFSIVNTKTLQGANLKTNDYFIGVLYTGYMDEQAILRGLNKINKINTNKTNNITGIENTNNTITEIIFHPYFSSNIPENKTNSYKEFLITQNPNLRQQIENSGFTLSDYSCF